MRRKVKWGKMVLAIALAGAMTVTSFHITPMIALAEEGSEQNQETMEYLDFEKIDHSKDFKDGVDVEITYKGTNATITGSDWGNDWGSDSIWQIQLKQLVTITKGEKYTVSVTFESATARDIFVKIGDNNDNNTVYGSDSISLEANTTYTYTKVTDVDVDIDELMVLFALGANDDVGTSENTIKVSNFSIKGEKSGYVKIADADTSTGKEYDFTKDNSAYDYADPGKSKAGYDLIWADEFDGDYGDSANVDATTGLNLDNWSYQLGDGTEVGNPGWGNNEKQSYTNRKENIAVNEDLNGDGNGDGMLRITASYEENGYMNAQESKKDYTSARIRTTSRTSEALFTTTYGYIESRMALPATKGAWPAFWMLPQSTEIYGNWPVSGEIDIMETCGAFDSKANNLACGTLHWGAPDHVYKGSGYVDLNSDYNYFHTYAIDWEPGKITWYYDGVAVHTLQNWESMISGSSDSLSYDAPFDQPFYILLNLAVDGGQFGGAVNRATFQSDINMYVDYVRAYQKHDGYATSVDRSASDSAKIDWVRYEGVNQIADITSSNLDANGFSSDAGADKAKWYLSSNANGTGGDATLESFRDQKGKTWAKVGIREAGSQDYSVQMLGHYDAKAGYVYKVSFDAYADGDMVGKSVNTDSKEWQGWSTNGIQSYELSSTPQNVAFTFEQRSDFDQCRIEFNLGAKATGNVYIANVKVEIIDPALINGDSGRKPLANGDVIYNGTFDQGSAHIGGWAAEDNTTISVPRYTTEKIAESDVKVVDTASKTNYENLGDGIKYYERRAQVFASSGAPRIYQPGIALKADSYTLNFDMYSKNTTTVQAAIYSVTEDGKLGTKMLESPVVDYAAGSGVKNYEWKFTTPRALANAALVLTFGDQASVQIDNVKMLGASQTVSLDENPVNAQTQWNPNGADGGALKDAGVENGVHKFTGVKSGANWYSPQITSEQFKTGAGTKYKMTAKLKLEGTSNNKISYIVQNQGSWEVIQNVQDIDLTTLGDVDEDGFYTYITTFTCPATSYNNVALNFGLGNSEATDATFSFKDVSLTVDQSGDSGTSSSSDMGNTQTGIEINYDLGADDAVNADANPFYYTRGEGTITLAAPSREGYLFDGWTLTADGTDYITEVSTDADSITVYAHWTEKKNPQITQPSDSFKDDTKPSTIEDKVSSAITGVKSSYTVKANGKRFTLKAEGYGEITFASSNSKVAKVDPRTGTVTVKGPGIVKITIKASGDDAHAATTKVVTIKVAPKKVTIKSAQTKKEKQLRVSWKRDTQVSGYEIQYSTDKNFRNAKTVSVAGNKTTSKSINKLKSEKKYYIRIRSYKMVGKTKLNGSWSKTDSVTTK